MSVYPDPSMRRRQASRGTSLLAPRADMVTHAGSGVPGFAFADGARGRLAWGRRNGVFRAGLAAILGLWIWGVDASAGTAADPAPSRTLPVSVPGSPCQWKLPPTDEDTLIRLLADARRVSPEGQQWLRRICFLKTAIGRARFRYAGLIGRDDVARTVELLSRPHVRERFAKIKQLPAAEQLEAYREFLAEHELDDYVVDLATRQLLMARKMDEWQRELTEAEAKLDRIVSRASISIAALQHDLEWELPIPPPPPPPKAAEKADFDATSAEQLRELLDTLVIEAPKP